MATTTTMVASPRRTGGTTGHDRRHDGRHVRQRRWHRAPGRDDRAGPLRRRAGTPGGTLRVGIVGSTNDLIDGQYIVTKTDQARLVAGWETLVNYDADFNISYEHGLAEEIETKAADLYVVRLKEGILFHDGKPVTADDVIYSFQRRLDPELGLAPALVELLDPSGLTKVDDRTVEIQLKQPAVTFINGLAEYTATIVPTGYERFAGDAANQIGTGPYILQSFTPGAESVHTKNPNYWGEGLPYLDEVQIIDFADVPALVNALTSGEIDAAVDIPFAQVSAVEGDSNLRLLESEAGSWLVITMAVDQPPFDDVRVRQAMRLIPNREEMVQRVLSGHGRVGNDMYGVFDACYPALPAARAGHRAGHGPARRGRPGEPHDRPLRARRHRRARRPDRRVRRPGVGRRRHRQRPGPRRRHLLGRRVHQAHVRHQLLGHPAVPQPGRRRQPAGVDLPGDALAAGGQRLRGQVPRGARRDRRGGALRAHRGDAAQEYEEGGNIIPFFNNLIDATAANVQGFVARPNVLNLDHFGRGFKNIWLD